MAGEPGATACHAPSTNLVIYPDGSVRVCCISNAVLGNIRHSALTELWHCDRRHRLVERLARHDYSDGCQGCGAEIAAEGRRGSYAESFDRFAPQPPGDVADWPHTIYFNLSNACNLQCVQCDGELSSLIRRYREHLPALPRIADEAFFEDLRAFIPHLKMVEFAGGEPFLAPETFRVLDLVHELAPDLPCRVITNGTQWNRRIVEMLHRHPMDVTVSVDGATPATFESIRVGADFEEVVANIGRFVEHVTEKGGSVGIGHCLMPDNVEEFPDMLMFAESMGLPVSVSVVRDPPAHSIVHLPRDRIVLIEEQMTNREAEMASSLRINLEVWRTELTRIRTWAGGGNEALRGHDDRRLMWFQRDGDGPVGDDSDRGRLEGLSIDGRVYGIRIGPGQVIDSVVDDLTPLTGDRDASLVGKHVRALMPVLIERFGEIRSMDGIRTLIDQDDRVEQVAVFPNATLRICSVPLRDEHGKADQASMLIARVGH